MSQPAQSGRTPAARGFDVACRRVVSARRDLLEFIRDRRTLFITLLLPMVTYPILALSTDARPGERRRARSRPSGAPERRSRWPVLRAAGRRPHRPGCGRRSAVFSARRAARLAGKVEFSRASRRGGQGDRRRHGRFAGSRPAKARWQRSIPRPRPRSPCTFPRRGPCGRRCGSSSTALMDGVAEDARRRRVATAGLPDSLLVPLRIDTIGQPPPQVVPVPEDRRHRGRGRCSCSLRRAPQVARLYPAIDAIAGEKERGTVETLLIAPVGAGACARETSGGVRRERSPRWRRTWSRSWRTPLRWRSERCRRWRRRPLPFFLGPRSRSRSWPSWAWRPWPPLRVWAANHEQSGRKAASANAARAAGVPGPAAAAAGTALSPGMRAARAMAAAALRRPCACARGSMRLSAERARKLQRRQACRLRRWLCRWPPAAASSRGSC